MKRQRSYIIVGTHAFSVQQPKNNTNASGKFKAMNYKLIVFLAKLRMKLKGKGWENSAYFGLGKLAEFHVETNFLRKEYVQENNYISNNLQIRFPCTEIKFQSKYSCFLL